jgi:hypothetical protein
MPHPVQFRNKIRKSLEADVKKTFGIQKLPDKVKADIARKAAEVSENMFEQHLNKVSLAEAKAASQSANVAQNVKGRLADALSGVQVVTKSADLDKILKENAELLFKKKQALVTAGFTDDEAFQIILAEVTARKSR